MRYFILPYKLASKSAKLLASSLNCKRIKPTNSRFQHTNNKLVINWGCTQFHLNVTQPALILNLQQNVRQASNKILTLETLKLTGVPHVKFTTDQTVAQAWVDSGNTTYCRSLVSSSGGRGISCISAGPIVPAPLYTRAFPTEREYRVHVFKGSVIDITQKKRRSGAEVNNQIRNHDNGWVFCRNNIEPLGDTNEQIAISGVSALGLDFGAVDLLVDSNNRAVICEVNSAPGLDPNGTTLQRYTQAFKSYLESLA